MEQKMTRSQNLLIQKLFSSQAVKLHLVVPCKYMNSPTKLTQPIEVDFLDVAAEELKIGGLFQNIQKTALE